MKPNERSEGTKIGVNLIAELARNREVKIQVSGLFTEATQAFDAGAYMGTVLLCRASLEAMLYTFLTRSQEEQPPGAWVVRAPLNLDGSLRRVHFTELMEAIRKRPVLSDSQLASADRIIEHGNIGAHLAARWDHMVERASKANPPWFWATRDEAWRDLSDTMDILMQLSKVLERQPDLAGPARPRSTKVETKLRIRARGQD